MSRFPNHSVLVFFTGAVILGIELTASRYMSPMFGSSLYIWGAILSVTLVCLAAGYSWGGHLGQRLARPVKRLTLFIIISACWIGLLPLIQRPIAQLGLICGPTFGPIVLTIVLFALPILLLATATPLVFAENSKQPENQKQISLMGDLFAISTIGSVFGALVTAYLLIPTLGLRLVLIVLSLMLFICAANNVLKGEHLGAAASSVILVVLAQLVFSSTPNAGMNSGFQFIHRESSSYGELSVVEDANGARLLLLDGTSQNWVGGEFFDQSLFEYTHVMAAQLSQYPSDNKKVLVLGLGAGVFPTQLKRLGYQVETVELNPKVLRLAREYFNFEDDQIVHLQDGRTFVEAARKSGSKYGAIILDVAGGGTQPSHIFNLNAFEAMADILEQDGVLISNQLAVLAESENKLALHTLSSLLPVFSHVRGFDCYPSEPDASLTNLVVASSQVPPADGEFRSRFREVLFEPDVSSLKPLSDNWNPANVWSVNINMLWHQSLINWVGYGAVIPI